MFLRILIILMVPGLFFSKLQAQPADTLTIEKAVEIALQDHPFVKAARLRVEREQKLKKTAFELDETKVLYSRGQLNTEVTDYNWQISQGFSFPTTYLSKARLQAQRIQLSEKALDVTALEMEQQVRSAFMKLAYKQQELNLLNELETTYARFSEVADKRYQAGETNLLEKTYASSYYQQVLLKKQQAEAEVSIYRQQLQQYLKTDHSWVIAERAFVKLMPPVSDSAGIHDNPVLQFYEKATDVSKQQHQVEKSGYLPDLSLGYINQQIEGTPGLSAMQLGVRIPLFFWAQQGRIQAAGIDREIAQAEYESQLRSVNTMFQGKIQELGKYRRQVEYYETQGAKTAEELLRFSSKSYQAGAIDYLEFTRNVEQAIQIKMEYLENLDQYNQVIIDLQFLTGSFNH